MGGFNLKYNFDEIVDRKNTDSIKWSSVSRLWENNDGLPLSTADMDFKSPLEIIQAIKERADHGVFGYAAIPDSYYEAVVNWVKSRHNWEINREWITCTSGVIPALNIAIVAFTKPGDSILIQTPVYPPFYSIIKNNNRTLVNNQLIFKDGRYSIDFDALEKQLSSGVKMMLLCSPHNPVGRVWSYKELKLISELCLKNNVLLVSDEIHSDIVYSQAKHIPLSSISEELANNSITCISPTKTFNIPGVGISTAIIPSKKLNDEFNTTLSKMAVGGIHNIFGILTSEGAYRYGFEWLKQLLAYLEGTADMMDNYINENIPGIKFSKPEGTYLGWLDCRELGIEYVDLREYFISKAKVELYDGKHFGSNGEGFLRFNFAYPRSVIKDALERIKASLS
jgi:cystathionine beta-lyase